MRIGSGLLLIAVGAILRFGISTVSTHGVAIHTIGDILMVVGVLGVVLWMVVWAPWSRSRRPGYRDEAPVYREEPVYRGEPVYREERSVYRTDAPADAVPPTDRYPADRHYQDEYRRSAT
jgi:hypothetical protein